MKRTKAVVAIIAAVLVGTAVAQTTPPDPAPAAGDEQVQPQPRFIWGILINLALSKLGGFTWDHFSNWAMTALSGGSSSSMTNSLVANLAGSSGAKVGIRSAAITTESGVVVGTPDAPLTFDDGKENYQGANIAILVADAAGENFQVRPVNQGFKTGERFKLRVLSTFGGELSIENINPNNVTRQIYPAAANQAVTLVQGKETIIPLGPDEYFQFAGTTGREQLVINLADQRAVGDRASKNKVFRQDVKYGSNFVQQVSANTYPFISQAIELQHDN
jgi:hypothetical protein